MSKRTVSICIPTFNGAKWILDCINSALGQSYRPLEILVVDDASTDDTVELVRSFKNERIRLIVNDCNIGLPGNWNRCVELAKGEFIKFLFQDDLLYHECVEKMMRLFLTDSNLGLVFSERDIILEAAEENSTTQEWLERNTAPHTKFNSLSEINVGRRLFAQHSRKEFRGNWVGEPSSVMVKKDCFARLGSFNVTMYQVCDVEMWLRIMFFYDVGFVREKLSAFRVHYGSASSANLKSQRHWLDQLRLIESLLGYDEIRSTHPQLRRMRLREIIRIMLRMMIPLPARRRFHNLYGG